VQIVCYVNNAIIISEDENNLQELLHRFDLEKYNMSISLQKIQSLVIVKELRRCELTIYHKSVDQVIMIFKYLEANITRDRNLEKEFQMQMTKAVIILNYLHDII